jgi:hypothetical protein
MISPAIWKAVAMAIGACLQSLGEVETCGEWRLRYCDRLLPARSQRISRLGGISFWGNFTVTDRHEPNQPGLAFQIAAIVRGMGGWEWGIVPFPDSLLLTPLTESGF